MKVVDQGITAWTQAEVGRRIGVTRSRVAQLLRERKLSLVTIRGRSYVSEDSIQRYEARRYQVELPLESEGEAA